MYLLSAALCDMYMEHVREISEPWMRAKMFGDPAAAEKWLAQDLTQVSIPVSIFSPFFPPLCRPVSCSAAAFGLYLGVADSTVHA